MAGYFDDFPTTSIFCLGISQDAPAIFFPSLQASGPSLFTLVPRFEVPEPLSIHLPLLCFLLAVEVGTYGHSSCFRYCTYILYYIKIYYIILDYFILYYIILYYIKLYYIILVYCILYYIILYYIILYYFYIYDYI